MFSIWNDQLHCITLVKNAEQLGIISEADDNFLLNLILIGLFPVSTSCDHANDLFFEVAKAT